MKRKLRKMIHRIHLPKIRTRRRSCRKWPAFLKPALLCLFAVLFSLVVIPFAVTRLFVPDPAPSVKTEDKTVPTKAEKTVSRVSVPDKIKVYRQALRKTETVDFEDYVKGVVASEMPSTFEKEALKAQAVAARTYSLSRYLNAKKDGNPSSHKKAPVCDTVHCQVYQDKNGLKKSKGSKWMKSDWKKISTAVEETKGQLMYYDGKLVKQALFHSSSGGKTENSEDVFSAAVPYLVSVDSPYEEDATHKKETMTLSISQFSSKLKAAYPKISFGTVTSSDIEILSRSSGGRVESMKVGNGTVSGVQVRQALSLYSANFQIAISGDQITFTTTGSGHGVGMSQYGANGMAKEGRSYKEILSHYYSGVEIF